VDELSPAGPNLVFDVSGDGVSELVVDPVDLGIERCRPEELSGGDPRANAEAIRRVLGGEGGGRRDAILLNGAAALVVAGLAADLGEGLELARDAVDSGAAAERLERAAAFSRGED
jgi:anthranilate phosphoribosyltransferase